MTQSEAAEDGKKANDQDAAKTKVANDDIVKSSSAEETENNGERDSEGEMGSTSKCHDDTPQNTLPNPGGKFEAKGANESPSSPTDNVVKHAESAISPSTSASLPRKVKVHFVAVGSAPILKKTKFKIDSNQTFAYLASNLRRTLRLTGDTKDELFLYLHSAFCPSPEDSIGELEECFKVRDELIVQYSLKEAWG